MRSPVIRGCPKRTNGGQCADSDRLPPDDRHSRRNRRDCGPNSRVYPYPHCAVVSPARVFARVGGTRRGSASSLSRWLGIETVARGGRPRLSRRRARGLDDARTASPARGPASPGGGALRPSRSRAGNPHRCRRVRLGVHPGARLLHTPARVGRADVSLAARVVLAAGRGGAIHRSRERCPPEWQPAWR